MKILTLIHEYPPVGGGGGRVAQDVARGLTERGHELVIITSHFKDLPKDEVVDGMRIVRVPALRREAFRASLPSMAAYLARGLWAGLRLIRQWRPDAIHVHFAVPAGALAWTLSRLTKTPYLLTAHLGDVPGGAPEKTGKWFKWIFPFTRPIWRDAAQVVAVSGFTRQLALERYPVSIQVIHNGVDTQKLDPGTIRVQSPPRIVFAGRFMEQKNPLQIVRTLAELKDLPWECVMIGDGPLLTAVRQEIEKNGLAERFTLTGWITPDEVLAWFAKSDILFMPSLSEGLPVVGVQALAMGLALVVSDIGGFVDLVDEGENGFLVGEGAEAFQAHLSILLDPKSTQMLYNFRKASLLKAQQFSLSEIVRQYEQVFIRFSAT
jgi:glycosyltransferase involved in cell wall biosynthesis